MTVEVWNETYGGEVAEAGVGVREADDLGRAMHRTRQNLFLQDCMRRYKRRGWTSWLVLVDTDEFVAVNDHLRHAAAAKKANRSDDIPRNDEPGSVMKFLKREKEKARSRTEFGKCVPIRRIQMCMDEEDPNNRKSALKVDAFPGSGGGQQQQQGQPWTVSNFLTHNFVKVDGDRDPKNMVDVRGIPLSYFESLKLPKDSKRHPIVHDPVPGYCLAGRGGGVDPGKKKSQQQFGNIRIPDGEALFQAYHYTGTEEQRTFRSDVRGDIGKRGGTKLPPPECPSQSSSKGGTSSADDIRPWLKGFVKMVGRQEAERLLDGVGRVHSWPPYGATS